jgi:hypothetical protein
MALEANGGSRSSMQPAACISSRFCPDRANRPGLLTYPFPWKMQRKKTSRCGAASIMRVAKALPVTAYV